MRRLSASQAAALVAADAAPAEEALALLTAEGVFRDRATAELCCDGYVALLRQIEFERAAGEIVEVAHVAKVVGEA